MSNLESLTLCLAFIIEGVRGPIGLVAIRLHATVVQQSDLPGIGYLVCCDRQLALDPIDPRYSA